MAKWPDVPGVFGWLGLDRRGRWRLKGELITNDAANRFIDRNYACDETGRWFFQNGPQRVFVSLAYAPFVYRLDDAGTLTAHTGRTARAPVVAASLDEEQNLTLVTDLGPGLVDDRDLEALSERLASPDGERLDDETVETELEEAAAGRRPPELALAWEAGEVTPIDFIPAAELGARLGFVREPMEAAGVAGLAVP